MLKFWIFHVLWLLYLIFVDFLLFFLEEITVLVLKPKLFVIAWWNLLCTFIMAMPRHPGVFFWKILKKSVHLPWKKLRRTVKNERFFLLHSEPFAVGLGQLNLMSGFLRPTHRGILWTILKKSIPFPEKNQKTSKKWGLLRFPWYAFAVNLRKTKFGMQHPLENP